MTGVIYPARWCSKVAVLILLFTCFRLYSVVSRVSKVHNFAISYFFFFFFFFCVDYYKVWSSDRDLVIRLYLKIPLEFVCLTLQDRCWVVHIPYVRKVKFQFLAQFSVDHFAHSIWTNLLHSLMWVIVSSLSPHNLQLLFCCVLSIFALIWLVLITLFCGTIRRDWVSLVRFPFLNHVHVFSCEMLLISRLKFPQSCFSSHFFSSYCRSVGPRVVSIVSGGCNQSSSALFFVVFKSLYWCVNTVFNADKSSSSFFSWYISPLGYKALWMVISFRVLCFIS